MLIYTLYVMEAEVWPFGLNVKAMLFECQNFAFPDFVKGFSGGLYSMLLPPPSEARGGYTKSIQGLDSHFWVLNDHNNHLAIIQLIHFPDNPDQKWGVQNDRLNKVFKTKPD